MGLISAVLENSVSLFHFKLQYSQLTIKSQPGSGDRTHSQLTRFTDGGTNLNLGQETPAKLKLEGHRSKRDTQQEPGRTD